MREQTKDAIGRGRQLRVVVVHRVTTRTVRERGVRGRRDDLSGPRIVAPLCPPDALMCSRTIALP